MNKSTSAIPTVESRLPIQKRCTCGAVDCQCDRRSFVYVLGQLRPFFSTRDLQREFEAAADYLGLKSDDYFGVFTYTNTPDNNPDLTFRPFLYIAEKACWVFSINNIDTYFVIPRYENELNALINALQPEVSPQTLALIGTLGPLSPVDYCDGLQLPIVICNQFLSESTDLMSDMPLKSNDGTTSEHRAVNFLAFNYPTIVPDDLTLPKPLVSIHYQFYNQANDRILVEAILTYFDQGVEEFYSCGIDVTDQYPFIDFALRHYVPSNT